ncbi:Uncharacterised protein [Serratia marcescens]|nr:Uncharacterised protein [Serratia marcescens]CUY23476.1 Uncharacterised protein [Serratia marcescens]CUY41115.1 Uncharacterised protein [Serratia marcescens]CUY42070.1 Uncharacterised protein [Serratia marcescens]CUY67621.1 Uncharacterised protein [Serratia marcescens]
MLGIPVKLRHILLLFAGVANYQRTFANPGLCRALGVPAVVGARQHAAGRVGQQILAHRPAGAEAAAAVRCAVVRLVVDVRPAQRAGIEAVFLLVSLACNHSAVELGVFFDLDVIPALAGKQPGLLFYRVEVAVQFVLAGAKIRRAAAGADRHADPAAHLGLPGIIAVAVLLAFQRQVTAHVDGNLFSAGLRAGQPGVAAAGHLEITARIQGGFGMRQAVAVLMPLAGIDAGRDADAVPARACADADTDVAAFAAVLADGAFAVLRRLQGNVPRRIERQVFARFQLAAGDDDIATLRVVVLAARRYRQVLPGGERAALRLVAVGAGFALRRLAAVGGADTHRIGGALRRTFVSRLQAGSGVFRLRRGGQRIIPLPGLCSLHAGQCRLGVLQRVQAPIAFFSRLLRRADGGVERAAHGARQRNA